VKRESPFRKKEVFLGGKKGQSLKKRKTQKPKPLGKRQQRRADNIDY
jgi:hypothetical protein